MTTKKRPVLKAAKREIIGQKVKQLRREGLIPTSLYGREIKSANLQVELKEILAILDKAGETGVVDLEIKGSKTPKPILLKNPQYDPVSDELIHIDLYQVDLKKKVHAAVPVELAGQSPAAKSGEGVLVQLIDEIEIEALPMDLPEKFIVDVSKLEKIDDSTTIADLKFDKSKIDLELEEDQVIAKVEPLMEEIEEEEPATTEVEMGGEEAEAEGGAEGGQKEGKANQGETKEPKADQGKEEKKPETGNEEKQQG